MELVYAVGGIVSSVGAMVGTIEALLIRLEIVQHQHKNLPQENARLVQVIADLRDENADLQQDRDELEKHVDNCVAYLELKDNEIEKLKEEVKCQSNLAIVIQVRDKEIEALLAERNEDIARSLSKKATDETLLMELSLEIVDLQEKILVLEEKHMLLVSKLQKSCTLKEDAKRQLQATELVKQRLETTDAIAEWRARVERLENRLEASESQRLAMQTQIQTLKGLHQQVKESLEISNNVLEKVTSLRT